MKRTGILNADLAGALAGLGHTDQVLVCDSGMPLPAEAQVVDLAFYVPHGELKLLAHAAKLIVRTGEARPYANVLVRCGVAF